MRINDVQEIDNMINFLRETRKAVAAYHGLSGKYDEAKEAYTAAKDAMQAALDADDFDGVQQFNTAIKRHHKVIADNHDKRLELEEAIREAVRKLDTWEDIACPIAPDSVNPEDNEPMEKAA